MPPQLINQVIDVVLGDPQRVADEISREFSDGEMTLEYRVDGTLITLEVSYPSNVTRGLAADRIRHWVERAAATCNARVQWKSASM